MDNFDNDSINLLEFIQSKVNKNEDKDPKKMIYMYSKCLRNAIVGVYNEQKNYDYSISCADLISNIFKIIYNYSLNMKLSLFICERSILLYNEYINISNSYSSDNINLMDVKQFIINKSIGPVIQSGRKKSDNLLLSLPLLCFFKTFIYKLFNKFVVDKSNQYDLSEYLESIISILINSYSNIYYLGYLNYIDNESNNILNMNLDNLPKQVNISKIKCELFLYSINTLSNDYHTAKSNTEYVIENKILIVDSYEDINNFFDYNQSISDKPFFAKLINYLKK